MTMLRKPPQWIDVREFGAKCDGKTDDSAAVQAAYNKAQRLGTRVYLPAGTTVKGGVDFGGRPPAKPDADIVISNIKIVRNGVELSDEEVRREIEEAQRDKDTDGELQDRKP